MGVDLEGERATCWARILVKILQNPDPSNATASIRGTAHQGTETNFDEFRAPAGQSYPPKWPLHPLNPPQNAAKNDPKWASPILDHFWLRFGVDLEGVGAILEGSFGRRQPQIRQNSSLSPGPLSPSWFRLTKRVKKGGRSLNRPGTNKKQKQSSH